MAGITKRDLVNWAIFLVMAVGTTAYLVSFARLVGEESELLALTSISTASTPSTPTPSQEPISSTPNKIMHATFTTSLGSFEVEFYPDAAPKTVENFTTLAQKGFYDGTRFHRVINDFMIQGGDPNSKDPALQSRWGTGGPGYQFADEINPKAEPYLTGYKRGVLAMANSGPNTNGSQFFVMHADQALPPLYTIFGHVTSGIETIDKIANVQTTGGPYDRPLTDVVLEKVVVK